MDLQLRCQCGKVQGVLHNVTKSTERYVCYCDDCQAYARKLGKFGHGKMPVDTQPGFPKSLIFFTILPFMIKGRILKKYQTNFFK